MAGMTEKYTEIEIKEFLEKCHSHIFWETSTVKIILKYKVCKV